MLPRLGDLLRRRGDRDLRVLPRDLDLLRLRLLERELFPRRLLFDLERDLEYTFFRFGEGVFFLALGDGDDDDDLVWRFSILGTGLDLKKSHILFLNHV